MFNTAKPARDAFTFSLGGLTAIASFAAAPAVADNRINQAMDERFSRAQEDPCNIGWDDLDPNSWPEPA